MAVNFDNLLLRISDYLSREVSVSIAFYAIRSIATDHPKRNTIEIYFNIL